MVLVEAVMIVAGPSPWMTNLPAVFSRMPKPSVVPFVA
jgi:hypothetical protein